MTLNLLLLKSIQTLKIPLLVLAGGVIILYALGRYEKSINARDSKLDKQTKAALALHKKWDTEYKLRITQSQAADIAIAKARRDAKSMTDSAAIYKSRMDSALASLDSTSTTNDSVRICFNALNNCKLSRANSQHAVDTLTRAISIITIDRNRWHTFGDSLHFVADTLATALRAEHNARDCHFLFIKCPSRVAVAAVSIVTTAIGILVIKH